jgi:hypothetical protein
MLILHSLRTRRLNELPKYKKEKERKKKSIGEIARKANEQAWQHAESQTPMSLCNVSRTTVCLIVNAPPQSIDLTR